MSEVALNDDDHPSGSNLNHSVQPIEIKSDYVDDESQDLSVESKLVVNGTADTYDEGPPAKRRKFTDEHDSHKSSPRLPSPPWKKITADGPTTFVENGRRRSGRTNIVPLDQQPQSGRRQTRAAYDKLVDKRRRLSQNVPAKPKIEAASTQKIVSTHQATHANTPLRKGPGRPPKIKTEDDKRPVTLPLSPATPTSRRRSSRTLQQQSSPILRKNRHMTEKDKKPNKDAQSSRLPSPPLILQKVKFRVALPKPSVMTPANLPQPKKYASFRDFLETDPLEPFTGQDTLTPEQIRKEARMRHVVYHAHQTGQLSGRDAIDSVIEKQSDVPRQFAHFDHLLAHINHFRHLLRSEHKEHRKKAEQIAHEAKRYVENKQRQGRVKTAEEVVREQLDKTRTQYRNIVKDLDKLWLGVQAEVNSIRQRQYEEEQQAKIKSHLNRVLKRTDEMLTRHEDSIITSDDESRNDELHDEVSGSSDSEDMSASSSESEIGQERNDPDEALTTEQLRAKYTDLQHVELGEESGVPSKDESAADFTEKVSDIDTDTDTEMDSEFDSQSSGEEDVGSEEDEDGDDDVNEDEQGGGLLSFFFSRKERADIALEQAQRGSDVPEGDTMTKAKNKTDDTEAIERITVESVTGLSDFNKPSELEQPTSDIATKNTQNLSGHEMHSEIDIDANASLKNDVDLLTPSATVEDLASQDYSIHTSPRTSATKQSEPDSVSSPEPHVDMSTPVTSSEDKGSIKTPIPSLLRGNLREYQHEGLDWLANLYANGRSGILADEMGLGKTIQSIALLAHLATEYEVWGPHLIVVPTSVMLNWEMEFKKFLPGFKILTYYGSLEERKQKRRGWMADDSFNVCITSYQLVLQDANSFKRRRWHYMILDEAHNIKNFRSERWQTMMTFNTQARLLLTGTPLQNNLTELWSLLFFLHYGQEGQDEDEAFAGLKEWSEWFKRPVESILEHGRQVLDQEDKEQVAKLHRVIRPFLLRRLKADVEKQMPAKYEHVEMCRLSKRQRQLYDGFMSRAQTKETLASGNYLSIINALMQLRKVCNHPDLFETRPITTSFAMPRSVAVELEIQDLLLRRRLLGSNTLDEIDLDFLQLVPISNEKISLIENLETVRRHAYHPFKALRDSQWSRVNRHIVPSGYKRQSILASLENVGRKSRLQDIDRTMYYEAYRHHQRPIYGRGLLEKLEIGTIYQSLSQTVHQRDAGRFWELRQPVSSLDLVKSIETRSKDMALLIEHYACVTPAVIATDLNAKSVVGLQTPTIQHQISARSDPFHQARMKLSIAFPDKRLLQYDCGKLQRLDKLLRELQAGGHRALIFTQMTKVLDILESFLNIHGHRYLRLDGATKIEQRQILTDRFNSDPRILCFILSSRSGGLGINLTGADTVIFYDLDWNPAMDRQCTDRAHRIGQTRDVHIHRFVSEHTIESNILRKANQKQLLDDVVIQEGDFTTDYLSKMTYKDMLDDQVEDDVAGAAIDRVLRNDKTAVSAFEQAEDQEDVSAAKVAAKEIQHADDGDFEDKVVPTPQTGESGTPGPFGATNAAIAETDANDVQHIDEYLLRLQTFLLQDVPLVPLRDKGKRGRKRGDDHRKRRPR